MQIENVTCLVCQRLSNISKIVLSKHLPIEMSSSAVPGYEWMVFQFFGALFWTKKGGGGQKCFARFIAS